MAIKEIAVITQFIDNTYCSDIIQGIQDFYKDKEVRLCFLEARSPYSDASDYEYQYWTSALLAQAKSFEAVIIISATYCTMLSIQDLANLLKPIVHGPVISVSIDLPFENSYYTEADCLSGYRELINHLITEHHCKRIAFVSAEKTSSIEGVARLNAYKTVLAENHMDFDPSLVIPSDFNQGETIRTFEERYKTKEDINFDAVVCANDYSALGAIYALKQLGLRIPDDVIVTGFDDCSAGIAMGLTSINQNITRQGYEAAAALWKIIHGEFPEHKIKVPVKPVYRRSCGCNYHSEKENSTGANFLAAAQYVDITNNYTNLNSLLDKMQSAHSLEELNNMLSRVLIEVDISAFALCLYKTPYETQKGQLGNIPEEATVTMHLDHRKLSFELHTDIHFNPRERILPEGILDTPSNYIVNPIFFGPNQYGYFLYRPGNKPYNLYSVYTRIVNNAIVLSYLYTNKLIENSSLEQQNQELSISSRTDELTKVFNRRGFLFLGQKSVDLALQMESEGLVLFGDMDGLKKINDTYGHEAGDTAIKAEAEILSKCFRQNDVIGRLGGDEFAIVAPGLKMEKLTDIRKQIEKECAAWKEKTNSSFGISISLGAAAFNKNQHLLEDLIALADSVQYEEKRAKHAGR
ncbi:MAG: GGDEF domain-containing protein [Treponema sp.]|nr:GGDEF domain-containing protein [Treponema sp.]